MSTPFQMMSRGQIRPSPLNPRKYFDAARLQELAASMANGVGIIEPLVVRPRPADNCYELIAGERRWRASEIAALDEVPVIVKDLTDAQVIEQMLIENGQREDINPLEEGEGYKQALKIGAFKDADALAAHVGKSRRHIYDAIKLVEDLTDESKELLNQGRITATHAVLLSRLSPAAQKAAIAPQGGGLFEWEDIRDRNVGDDDEAPPKGAKDPLAGKKLVTVREFESWINQHVKLDVKNPKLPEYFPEAAAALQQAESVVHISHETYLYSMNAQKERIRLANDWRRADGLKGSQPCDHAILGVVVVGGGRGQAFKVCVTKSCDIHFPKPKPQSGASSSTRSTSSGPSESEASRKRRIADEKRARARREKERQETEAWKQSQAPIKAAIVAALKSSTSLKPAVLFEVATRNLANMKEEVKLLGAVKSADDALRVMALSRLLDDLQSTTYAVYGREEFVRLAKSVGVDVQKLLEKAVQSTAQPQSKKTASKSKKKAA